MVHLVIINYGFVLFFGIALSFIFADEGSKKGSRLRYKKYDVYCGKI